MSCVIRNCQIKKSSRLVQELSGSGVAGSGVVRFRSCQVQDVSGSGVVSFRSCQVRELSGQEVVWLESCLFNKLSD